MIQLQLHGYTFPSVNKLMRVHWAVKHQLTRAAKNHVLAAKLISRAEAASGPRRVSMTISKPRGRLRDPDNCWKLALDSLVAAGLLIDDSAKQCVLGEITQIKGPLMTTIVLEEHLNGR